MQFSFNTGRPGSGGGGGDGREDENSHLSPMQSTRQFSFTFSPKMGSEVNAVAYDGLPFLYVVPML
jgi:hypothetical protein